MDFPWDACTAGVADSARKRRTSNSRCDQPAKRKAAATQCHAVAKPVNFAHGVDAGHGKVAHVAKSRGGAGSPTQSMCDIARLT